MKSLNELNIDSLFGNVSIDSNDALIHAISKKNQWVEKALEKSIPAMSICGSIAHIYDHILITFIKSLNCYNHNKSKLCVLALGGYGRFELSPKSDLDLLFIHENASNELLSDFSERLLYPFWNNHIDIGGASRSLSDCKDIINSDAVALTAMLDARYLCGNYKLYDELRQMIISHFENARFRRNFINRKIDERDNRLQKQDNNIFLLQPSIKEGEGGLRDYQTLIWVAMAYFQEWNINDAVNKSVKYASSIDQLQSARDFIWQVRHHLHYLSKKCQDRLLDFFQDDIAICMDYQEQDHASASEQLMTDYYRFTSIMHLKVSRVMEYIKRKNTLFGSARRLIARKQIEEGLIKTEYNTIRVEKDTWNTDPLIFLKAFHMAAQHLVPIDAKTKDDISQLYYNVPHILFCTNAQKIWQQIFQNIDQLPRILMEMQECQYLVKWFPEMQPIAHLVQHDGYHMYTTCTHSIRALSKLSKLLSKENIDTESSMRHARSAVINPMVVILATLFHDIGKGRCGNHETIGGTLVARVASRMGLRPTEIEDISFLVKSHSLMSTLAFKRDISDQSLLIRFAQSLRSTEMLSMLYLLTISDIQAVSPTLWNDWKSGLLKHLYNETYHLISEGAQGIQSDLMPEQRQKDKTHIYFEICKLVPNDTCEEIFSFLQLLPERYIFLLSNESIVNHYNLGKNIKDGELKTYLRLIPELNCHELSIITKDRHGLFARLAGVLSSHGCNIIDAQLFTTTTNVAVDVFWITDIHHKSIQNEHLWHRVFSDLDKVTDEFDDIFGLINSRLRQRVLGKPRRKQTVKIMIDNDVSALQTVVEIHAPDRKGLLFDIANYIQEKGMSVDIARISTHTHVATDVFYIRDTNGKKIEDKELLASFQKSLSALLR